LIRRNGNQVDSRSAHATFVDEMLLLIQGLMVG